MLHSWAHFRPKSKQQKSTLLLIKNQSTKNYLMICLYKNLYICGSSMHGAISKLYCMCCCSLILLNSAVIANSVICSQSQSVQNFVPFSSKYPATSYAITNGTTMITAIIPIFRNSFLVYFFSKCVLQKNDLYFTVYSKSCQKVIQPPCLFTQN